MHCLYCGKPLGFLKELTDGEFCSSSHRQRYKKLTKLALSRLLETQPQELPEEAKTPERPRMPAWGVAARKRADFGKLFCPSPQATQLPAHVQGGEEPIGRPPSTTLPGFAQAPLTPALGNASLVWAKLEPAAPQAGLFMQVPVEPSDASGPMLRFASLSGLLRQGIAPSLRQAGILPPPTPGLQSIRSSHVVEDRTARPVLMFAPAIARPSLARVAEPPSLPLAPSIQLTLEA